ncbi:DNA-binding MarR family transcriptional regulator [Saccharomonospora amisosensis]|uniref:DNA-binding MarR family transcriptional regulator n=1 Tax=Saccharomonospora amisosensis TaxID=1128677 RepID=A0A7X5ULJ4_9PSEU|nr:MarR family transcriptional regulator [Saccharomonospora amisosensis]NIJ10220.1 DNA-binding MarR family transcriptional regulator [Saccharomonospora amisosensis]
MPNEPDDEVVALWGLVTEGYLATQDRLLGEIAQRFGLAPASFDILLRLARAPQHRMPMTRLAKEAALSSGGFTKVADRLVAAGLVRRLPSPQDRRVTYVCLTTHGVDIAAQARKASADILRRTVLSPLGPQTTAALADAMRTLREVNRS